MRKSDLRQYFGRLTRIKNLDGQNIESEYLKGPSRLKKCLTTLDLTSLGVGSCVGTGMYLVAGLVAKSVAGPGVIISFIIAAMASIFSGACYAEFGVRVPHTSGSAYMYAYVTVGEFIAFVIGWNMILEYLIGTSACASALSACFNALTGGAIETYLKENISVLGHTPDFLAFTIALLMMFLLIAGVKKSLIFNNVLNTINLSIWVFIIAAGLFYVDTENWTSHGGFLPYGWSGVLTGAATCFYAFIGFDIIATTGEEARNPKKSIPIAIISSLTIILIAYVTSSAILTLIVPCDEIDEDSAMMEMFGHVNATSCKFMVAIGALAGLTVSMFGSMFPMPRIIYAMAQDGLIFREFSHVWPATGTPVFATSISGIAAAFAALFIPLEILVEMMSIGTLLAYTLVSTCVLILRYQPRSTNIMQLLPLNLREGFTRTDPYPMNDDGVEKFNEDILKQFLDANLPPISQQTNVSLSLQNTQRVTIRRITRSSPDSDDTYDEENNVDCNRDDQMLVKGCSDDSNYGSLEKNGYRLSCLDRTVAYISYKIKEAKYVCPAIFPWINDGPVTQESGIYVIKMVGCLYIVIIIFDILMASGMYRSAGIAGMCLYMGLIAILSILLAISRKPQVRNEEIFTTPGLPFVPAFAITINIYLILKLSVLTLLRFTVWMSLGLVMYFCYGIRNSTLESP